MVKTLANNKVQADSEQLVKNMMCAALLTLEKNGNITFEVRPGENVSTEMLVAMPTGKPVSFPPKTLESRLNIALAATVEDIVYDWLAVDSREPWERAVEQGTMLLAIKGLVSVSGLIDKDYQLSPAGEQAVKDNTDALQATQILLKDCQQQHPGTWAMLNRDIVSAVKRRTHKIQNSEDHYNALPAWHDESEQDRAAIPETPSSNKETIIMIVAVAAGLVPMITFFLYEYFRDHWLGVSLVLVALVGLIIVAALFSKTKDAINEKVLGKPQKSGPVGAPVTGNPLPKPAPPVWETNVKIDIIHGDALPPISAESQERLNMITLREPAYYKVCQKLLLVMCTSFTIVVLVYGLFFRVPVISEHFGYKFVFFFLFFLYTMLMLIRPVAQWLPRATWSLIKSLLLNALFGSGGPSDSSEKKEQKFALRPTGKLLMIGCWWALIIYLTIVKFAKIPATAPRYGCLLVSGAILVGSYIWFRKLRRELEQQYPYQPPVNLLALRVFGSPYLTDFLRLTKSWQWLGTTQRLDGPDTTGEKVSDVFNYLTGHIDRSIVKTQEELDQHISAMKQKPDRKLRFPLNAMQCMNDTWMNALQYLLDKADVVIMDYSFLDEKNKGVAYEVGKLFDQFSTDRLVFLVNDTTDMQVLQQIVDKAWNTRSKESPNLPGAEPRITCVHTGVMPERRENESYYDWKKRFEVPIDGDHLVGIMYDRSQPLRNPVGPPNEKTERNAIHWTNIPIPFF